MIFNPYNLPQLAAETVQTASPLPWAMPQLQDNAVLVVLVLVFLMGDLLACCTRGVMRYQASWLLDVRNARTFESTLVIYPWLKPLLLIQVFLFFGLTLFCIFEPSPALQLKSPGLETWGHLGLYCSGLLGWFIIQSCLFNWFCYLLDFKERCTIMNRSFRAIFAVLAPLVTLVFASLIAGSISTETALILLAVLFILSQISFIFNGFRIFYDGFGSIITIIVYLCTLEIAPLWIILTKITTQQV